MRGWLRLYPSDWREHFGEELEALLEEYQLTLVDALDMVRGVVDAWRHPVGLERGTNTHRRRAMNIRMEKWAGFALMLAGSFWIVLVLPNHTPPMPWRFFAFASDFGLAGLGLSGLSVHNWRRGQRHLLGEFGVLITASAFIMLLGGFAVGPALGTWASSDLAVGVELRLFVMGLALQGVAAMMSRTVPLWSSLLLVLAGTLAISLTGAGPARVLILSVSWLLVGCSLLLAPMHVRRVSPSVFGVESGK